MLRRLILSAPFGNYLHFDLATSTLGTFTCANRGGFLYRLWRVLRTVRPYPRLQACVNKLGLPNPGLHWLEERCQNDTVYRQRFHQCIVSVAGHNLHEWICLLQTASLFMPAALEMNVSCPNCPGSDTSDYAQVFQVAARIEEELQVELIVKLPPVGYLPLLRKALDAGLRSFHCCNTLPTPGGGLSGKPLKPFSLQAVQDTRNLAHAKGYALKTLIGGGGVTTWEDAQDYLKTGATNVAVGSVLFLPWKWRRIKRLAVQLLDYPVLTYQEPVPATQPDFL